MSNAFKVGRGKEPPAPPPPMGVFCPTCLKRSKVAGDFPRGKRVRCPGCQTTFDPHAASSTGTTRLKTQAALREDDGALAEWKWALLIGGGNGLWLGGLVGGGFGLLLSTALEAMGLEVSLLLGTLIYAGIGAVFYAVVGCGIALAMVVCGTSVAGYVVGAVAAVPAYFLFAGRLGVAVTAAFTILIERILDYKLYS